MTLTAADFRIKHKDYFNMKTLYVMMHEWLVQEGYAPRNDPDFGETFYLHRDTLHSGQELWIWWRVEKKPAANSFYRFKMNIDFHIILLRDAEVMYEGQKYKANWGEPEIKIKAVCESDYEKKWRNNWFLNSFYEVFWKRTYKLDFELHKHELYREAYRFQEAIKTYLKLQTYLPEPELARFWPKKDLTM